MTSNGAESQASLVTMSGVFPAHQQDSAVGVLHSAMSEVLQNHFTEPMDIASGSQSNIAHLANMLQASGIPSELMAQQHLTSSLSMLGTGSGISPGSGLAPNTPILLPGHSLPGLPLPVVSAAVSSMSENNIVGEVERLSDPEARELYGIYSSRLENLYETRNDELRLAFQKKYQELATMHQINKQALVQYFQEKERAILANKMITAMAAEQQAVQEAAAREKERLINKQTEPSAHPLIRTRSEKEISTLRRDITASGRPSAFTSTGHSKVDRLKSSGGGGGGKVTGSYALNKAMSANITGAGQRLDIDTGLGIYMNNDNKPGTGNSVRLGPSSQHSAFNKNSSSLGGRTSGMPPHPLMTASSATGTGSNSGACSDTTRAELRKFIQERQERRNQQQKQHRHLHQQGPQKRHCDPHLHKSGSGSEESTSGMETTGGEGSVSSAFSPPTRTRASTLSGIATAGRPSFASPSAFKLAATKSQHHQKVDQQRSSPLSASYHQHKSFHMPTIPEPMMSPHQRNDSSFAKPTAAAGLLSPHFPPNSTSAFYSPTCDMNGGINPLLKASSEPNLCGAKQKKRGPAPVVGDEEEIEDVENVLQNQKTTDGYNVTELSQEPSCIGPLRRRSPLTHPHFQPKHASTPPLSAARLIAGGVQQQTVAGALSGAAGSKRIGPYAYPLSGRALSTSQLLQQMTSHPPGLDDTSYGQQLRQLMQTYSQHTMMDQQHQLITTPQSSLQLQQQQRSHEVSDRLACSLDASQLAAAKYAAAEQLQSLQLSDQLLRKRMPLSPLQDLSSTSNIQQLSDSIVVGSTEMEVGSQPGGTLNVESYVTQQRPVYGGVDGPVLPLTMSPSAPVISSVVPPDQYHQQLLAATKRALIHGSPPQDITLAAPPIVGGPSSIIDPSLATPVLTGFGSLGTRGYNETGGLDAYTAAFKALTGQVFGQDIVQQQQDSLSASGISSSTCDLRASDAVRASFKDFLSRQYSQIDPNTSPLEISAAMAHQLRTATSAAAGQNIPINDVFGSPTSGAPLVAGSCLFGGGSVPSLGPDSALFQNMSPLSNTIPPNVGPMGITGIIGQIQNQRGLVQFQQELEQFRQVQQQQSQFNPTVQHGTGNVLDNTNPLLSTDLPPHVRVAFLNSLISQQHPPPSSQSTLLGVSQSASGDTCLNPIIDSAQQLYQRRVLPLIGANSVASINATSNNIAESDHLGPGATSYYYSTAGSVRRSSSVMTTNLVDVVNTTAEDEDSSILSLKQQHDAIDNKISGVGFSSASSATTTKDSTNQLRPKSSTNSMDVKLKLREVVNNRRKESQERQHALATGAVQAVCEASQNLSIAPPVYSGLQRNLNLSVSSLTQTLTISDDTHPNGQTPYSGPGTIQITSASCTSTLPIRPGFTQAELPLRHTSLHPGLDVTAGSGSLIAGPAEFLIPQAKTALIYDPAMGKHQCACGSTSRHHENPTRIEAIWNRLGEKGLAQKCITLAGRKAKAETLQLIHSPLYTSFFGHFGTNPADIKGENQESVPALVKLPCGGDAVDCDTYYSGTATASAARMAAGCVVELASAIASGTVSNGFAIVRPPGHHAEASQALGFCYFNNVAVATAHLLATDAVRRVAILDWDVHHGNGTAMAFAEDPRALYISLHRHDDGNFYPGTGHPADVGTGPGAGFTVNIGFSAKSNASKTTNQQQQQQPISVSNDTMEASSELGNPNDSNYGRLIGEPEYLAAYRSIVAPILAEFRPEVILVSAGFDGTSTHSSNLGGYALTPAIFGFFTADLSNVSSGQQEPNQQQLPDERSVNILSKLLSATGAAGGYHGRLGLALEGGYDLQSLADCAEECVRALIAGKQQTPFTTDILHAKPLPAAVDAITAVAQAHAPYWKCCDGLTKTLEPKQGVATSPSEVLGISHATWIESNADWLGVVSKCDGGRREGSLERNFDNSIPVDNDCRKQGSSLGHKRNNFSNGEYACESMNKPHTIAMDES